MLFHLYRRVSALKVEHKRFLSSFSNSTRIKSRKRSIANLDCKQYAHKLTKPFSILDHNFFASTLPGLEHILKQELTSLGITIVDNDIGSKGGIHVRFKSLEELYKCHLYLGSCSHIFLRINEGFVANGMEELVRKVSKLQVWRQLIPCEKGRYPYFKITVSSKESKLYHTTGIAQRVERGIYLALGLDEYIHVGTIEERSITTSEPIPILVRIRNNKVQLSIDTSISPMHKRGYRLESAKAPLREDIAFALLYALGWKDSTINMNPILVDPLCGSGTILIEGAAMFFNLPAGRYRDTPMKYTLIGDSLLWEKMVQTATLEAQNNISKYLVHSKATPLAFGSDRDAGAIKAAVSNIQRADLSDVIKVSTCSLSSNPWISGETPTECNVIYLVTNPPYGVRVSHSKSSERVDKLLPLYQTIGNIVKPRGDVHLGMTVHDILLARKTGIPCAKTLFTTKHGGLTVSAVGFKNNKI